MDRATDTGRETRGRSRENVAHDVRIRLLERADAAALKASRVAALQQTPDAFLSTAAEVERMPLSAFEAELADADIRYVGAFEDARLIGFMRYVRLSRDARRHVAELRSVSVAASHRHLGIARRLLARLVEEAARSGIEALTLTLVDGNTPARRLYEAAGFVLYGIEPHAIRKGTDYFDQLHLRLAIA